MMLILYMILQTSGGYSSPCPPLCPTFCNSAKMEGDGKAISHTVPFILYISVTSYLNSMKTEIRCMSAAN